MQVEIDSDKVEPLKALQIFKEKEMGFLVSKTQLVNKALEEYLAKNKKGEK